MAKQRIFVLASFDKQDIKTKQESLSQLQDELDNGAKVVNSTCVGGTVIYILEYEVSRKEK